jgi:hypothetical protein
VLRWCAPKNMGLYIPPRRLGWGRPRREARQLPSRRTTGDSLSPTPASPLSSSLSLDSLSSSTFSTSPIPFPTPTHLHRQRSHSAPPRPGRRIPPLPAVAARSAAENRRIPSGVRAAAASTASRGTALPATARPTLAKVISAELSLFYAYCCCRPLR